MSVVYGLFLILGKDYDRSLQTIIITLTTQNFIHHDQFT